MIKKMGVKWKLRARMAERELFQTSELLPLLAERGIHLSREQVYRLVTQDPQRLSMDTLAALCDVLACTPNDLIEIDTVHAQVPKTADGTSGASRASAGAPEPRRTTIRRPPAT